MGRAGDGHWGWGQLEVYNLLWSDGDSPSHNLVSRAISAFKAEMALGMRLSSSVAAWRIHFLWRQLINRTSCQERKLAFNNWCCRGFGFWLRSVAEMRNPITHMGVPPPPNQPPPKWNLTTTYWPLTIQTLVVVWPETLMCFEQVYYLLSNSLQGASLVDTRFSTTHLAFCSYSLWATKAKLLRRGYTWMFFSAAIHGSNRNISFTF